MKTIGLIGGMSWESSLEYYRIINERVKEKLGGLNSAEILMSSVNFAEIGKLQHQGKWDELTKMMIDVAQNLEKGGADFLLICTNTMHKLADDIEAYISIPLLNIIDVTAEAIKSKGLKKIGLLGTQFIMEENFYKDKLLQKHHLDIVVPDQEDRQIVHQIIYQELCLGKINNSSRERYVEIINKLVNCGTEAVILGCTEISMLIKPKDVDIFLLDTTRIHAEMAVNYSLA